MASLDASAPANATAFIKPSLVIPLDGKEATCSCFSEDGTWLAISYNSGAIETYKTQDGRLSFTLKSVAHKHPCTSVCFRPNEGKFSTKNVLISGDVGGQVHHWHATSGKHLGTIKELGNEIFTLAYQQTGEMFATAGLDTKIRIYDGMTRNISYVLEEGDGVSTTGHTNRVFCVKWSPIDDHVILSGGWDRTIQIWDVRVQKSVRSIFGPNLCGNSLDINDNTSRILTGSWRASEQLQEWDYGSGKLIGTFFWPTDRSIEKACHIYSACYGRNMFQHLVVAGGSGSNQACLFNTKTGQGGTYFALIAFAVTSYALFLCAYGRLFLYLALVLLLSVAACSGYYRIQMRRRFNLKGSDSDGVVSAVDDCLNHILCGCCTLCQEARTLEMNNVQDGNWHGRGDTVWVGSYAMSEDSQPAELKQPVTITISTEPSSQESDHHSWDQTQGSHEPLMDHVDKPSC